MNYYPIFIDITTRKTLVVGGGTVAERKINNLKECGALITVIAPSITDNIALMETSRQIEILRRPYHHGDMKGYTLVIAATNSEEVNFSIYQEALQRRILINIVDQQYPGCFINPAVIERGDLICVLSSSGVSPFFIKQLKRYFERKLYSELKSDLECISELRRKILSMPNLSQEEKEIEFTKRMQPKIDTILSKIEAQ